MTQYTDLVKRLEPSPSIGSTLGPEDSLASIAISLKRIADALDTGEGRDPLAWYLAGLDDDPA